MRLRTSLLTMMLVAGALAPVVGWGQGAAPAPVPARPSAPLPNLVGGAANGLPQVFTPTRSVAQTGLTRYPWKMEIVSTIFWVGEEASQNNPVANKMSSWDMKWEENFGGYDDPKKRKGYLPEGFVPKLNPFYIALPYNDVGGWSSTKVEAERWIPWFKEKYKAPGKTVLKGTWLAIRHDGKVCYAQWEDCGPFNTTDASYVFGRTTPVNFKNGGAGIDVSPAVRDYLGLLSGEKCDWRFVDAAEVPDGPWKNWTGAAEPAPKVDPVLELQRERLQELRRQRDEWMKSTGAEGFQRR